MKVPPLILEKTEIGGNFCKKERKMKRKTIALVMSATMGLGMTPSVYAEETAVSEQAVVAEEESAATVSESDASEEAEEATEVASSENAVPEVEEVTEAVVSEEAVSENEAEAVASEEAVSENEAMAVVSEDEASNITASGTSTDGTVSYVLYDDGSAVVSGTGKVDGSLFPNKYIVTSITIESGVTEIGENAFEGCWQLKSVSIPDSVKKIGEGAFYGCSSLTSINLPSGLETVEASLFEDCESLTDITIPAGVTTIGEAAFRGCSSLTSVSIPTSVTEIGDYIFGDEYPSALKVKYAGSKTVWDSVTIGADNDWSYDDNVMEYSDSISFVIDNDGNAVISGNGSFEGTVMTEFSSHKDEVKTITIEDGITSIGVGAFFNFSNLESVTIADSVTEIGRCAFMRCTNLKSVKLPSGLTVMNTYLFASDSKLISVSIPKSVNAILDYVFDENNATLEIQYEGTEAEWNALLKTGTASTNTVLSTAKVIYNCKAHTHSYGFKGWVSGKEPTCLEPGTMIMECTFCHDTFEQKAVYLGDHNEVELEDVAPTCETAGSTGGTICTYCNEVITVPTEIPALGHVWSEEGTVTKNATCAEEGVRTYACTREGCDKTTTESIGKLTPTVSAKRASLSGICKFLGLGKITLTSSIENYEYATVEDGKIGDITARGIVYADAKVLGSDELVIGANGSKAFAVPAGNTDETYSWDIVPFGKNREYTVRSWVQYTNSDGEVSYAFSEPVTVSYNGLK